MKKFFFTLFAIILAGSLLAQDDTQAEGYKFTDSKTVEVTPVKNQSRSGTCWSFAGNAFLESELLRQGKGEVILSEMWVVRNTYYNKAVKYVRMHGENNFAGGGALQDVLDVWSEYGMVPEEAYPGLNYGTTMHNHSEIDRVLEAFVNGVIKGRTLTPAWKDALNGILDAYFGPVPETFTYNGKQYTPRSFADFLGLDMNDYVSITSFTHHPFYSRFAIEIPDNWAYGLSYNVPLEEMMAIIDNSLENGYSVCWGSDVSEKGFAWNKGFAVVPEADLESMDGTEQARWVALTDAEKEVPLYKFEKPGKEKTITQELRQEAFDNYETTDDHGMQIVGIAYDQQGNKYYKVKNSWGTGNHIYGGYFYASYPFVAFKTINVIVNKNAVTANIAAKLNLK